MKFVPFRLFRFLHVPPVDIEKHVKTHFEATLEELTRQNSDYHREIIQLGNQIIQLSGELEETKQELEASKNKADHLKVKVSQLQDVCENRNLERERLYKTLDAHRDAFRVVVNTLTNLGAKDPNTDGL
jgi:predicted RNase H-like nuclease (RuvC/YqgF family)